MSPLGYTNIPYLTRSWHPSTGCSQGCTYCWARLLVRHRLAGTMKGLPVDADPFRPTFHANRLADPLRARKPQVIGVSFLGDLFDPAITDEQIMMVADVVRRAAWHTFVLLTKQSKRMRDLGIQWPDNAWLGVSVEAGGSSFYDRVGDLGTTDAQHRWVSYEPALGSLGWIAEWLKAEGALCLLCHGTGEFRGKSCPDCLRGYVYGLDLVIMGGQSGPNVGPEPAGWWDWARSIRDQCAKTGCAFYLKQGWGPRPEKLPLLDGVRHDVLPWTRREEK